MTTSNIAKLNDRRVLVLGGTGFIGTHLVETLVRRGMYVRVFDRHAPVVASDVSTDKGCAHEVSGGTCDVDMVRGDFATGDGLATALEGIDLVYHLISTSVPSTSNIDPIADVQGNLIGTLRLLQLMQAAGVARIVYVSSGGTVYGNPSILPVPESHALSPLCSYGVVKVAIENYLRMYSELYGIIGNVLRVSNPYGVHQRRIGIQGVIPTFFKKIADAMPIEIWGDGSVVRDYIDVSDVVAALLNAGARDSSGTFNIGSGTGHSVNEILDIVQQQVGRKANVRYLPERKFDVERIILDIAKAREQLKWQPLVPLETGCARYWQAVKTQAEV